MTNSAKTRQTPIFDNKIEKQRETASSFGHQGGPNSNSPTRAANRRSAFAQSGARALGKPGGGERNRTDDLLLAKQALSQLSYTPVSEVRSQVSIKSDPRSLIPELVGRGGFEPPTSRLSSARSNQLSYQPVSDFRSQASDIRQNLIPDP